MAAAAPSPDIRTLLDDGGWCWFEDERALLMGDRLIFATIASGHRGPERKGNVQVTQYDLKTRDSITRVLHEPKGDPNPKQWMDDHNSPALLERPDGRLLALYARHGTMNQIHARVSERKRDATAWGPEKIIVPSEKSRVTYSNLFYLATEKRIYNFYRGFDNSFKPSFMWSDDLGESWQHGGVFIDVPTQFRHRPYVKYCSNGTDTIHIAYTEGHPRNYDNSVYHVIYRKGMLHKSDGTPIRPLKEGLRSPEEGTRVFSGDANNVGWTADIHMTPRGELMLGYTVQKDSGGLADRQHGADHRFRLARWNGEQWDDGEIAYAGSRLYPGEDDYTGLLALDAHDPLTVFISTDAHPVTGKPLLSSGDGKRHREIFRGTTRDRKSYDWTPVTKDSTADNVRPIIPIAAGPRRAVLWLHGVMRAYTDYDFEVRGFVERR